MKLLKKSTWFKRPVIEMTLKEYEVYKLGRAYGIMWGFGLCAVFCCVLIFLLNCFGIL